MTCRPVAGQRPRNKRLDSGCYDCLRLSANLVPNLRIERVAWSAQRIPTAVNLCFLDLEPLLFHSSSCSVISTRLSGPVLDTLLLRKSACAGNRTRHLRICSQELWFTSRKVSGFEPRWSVPPPIYVILPAALWPWGRLSLQQKWVPGIFLVCKERPARKADNLAAIWELIVWRKYGSLDVSQPYGAFTDCYQGLALPFSFSNKVFLITVCR
jgi:hypothetical protein